MLCVCARAFECIYIVAGGTRTRPTPARGDMCKILYAKYARTQILKQCARTPSSCCDLGVCVCLVHPAFCASGVPVSQANCARARANMCVCVCVCLHNSCVHSSSCCATRARPQTRQARSRRVLSRMTLQIFAECGDGALVRRRRGPGCASNTQHSSSKCAERVAHLYNVHAFIRERELHIFAIRNCDSSNNNMRRGTLGAAHARTTRAHARRSRVHSVFVCAIKRI